MCNFLPGKGLEWILQLYIGLELDTRENFQELIDCPVCVIQLARLSMVDKVPGSRPSSGMSREYHYHVLLLYVVWTGNERVLLWLLWLKRVFVMSAYDDEVIIYSCVYQMNINCLHI